MSSQIAVLPSSQTRRLVCSGRIVTCPTYVTNREILVKRVGGQVRPGNCHQVLLTAAEGFPAYIPFIHLKGDT